MRHRAPPRRRRRDVARLRAGMQVAGARIVAESGPRLEHIIERRRRELFDRGEALEEAGIVRRHGADRGLLQHDLGEPDPIRISDGARPRPPWQDATMAIVPGEKRGRIGWRQRGAMDLSIVIPAERRALLRATREPGPMCPCLTL